MKRVVIVNAGSRLSLSADSGDYDGIVDTLQRQINGFEDADHPGKKVASAEVINSVEAARAMLGRVDVVIFVTAGLLHEARIIAQGYPHIRVVVLTGLIPSGEVVVLSKYWWTPELIQNAVSGL